MALDPGPGAAPVNHGGGSNADLELSFEDVEKIGQDTSALTEKTEAARAKLADAVGSPGDFSSYGPAQALFAQHRAVVEVFDKTLAAMTTDIDNFGNQIVQAARNHAQTDGDVLAALAVLGSKVDGRATRDAHNEARNQAGYDLVDVDEGLDADDELDTYAQTYDELLEPSIDELRPEDAGNGGGGGTTLDGSEPQ